MKSFSCVNLIVNSVVNGFVDVLNNTTVSGSSQVSSLGKKTITPFKSPIYQVYAGMIPVVL